MKTTRMTESCAAPRTVVYSQMVELEAQERVTTCNTYQQPRKCVLYTSCGTTRYTVGTLTHRDGAESRTEGAPPRRRVPHRSDRRSA